MPKKTNALKSWYVLFPDEADPHLLELLKTIHHLRMTRDAGGFFTLEQADALESEVHACLSREDVEANTWFRPAIEFFQERPLQSPFWLATYHPHHWETFIRALSPISLIYEVAEVSQLEELELALDEDIPLRVRAHYLFGSSLWELSPKDRTADDEQLRLLFLEAVDTERRRFERLKRKFSGQAGKRASRREAIPEDVRIFVWRRDEGKCVRCGSQTRLEFDHIIPVSKGGGSTARNIQLLCERCNREKSDEI